jgi:thioredoxin
MDSKAFADVLRKEPALALKFSARWCAPCRTVAPLVERYAEEHKDVKLMSFDIDKDEEITSLFGITAVPTFLFFRRGVLAATVRGTAGNEIRDGFRSISSAYPMTS